MNAHPTYKKFEQLALTYSLWQYKWKTLNIYPQIESDMYYNFVMTE